MDSTIKRFWEHEFGDNEVGSDFAGWEVRKGSYAQEGSRYGWNVDHILPLSMGGTDEMANLQITHIETNIERGNKITFWLDNAGYQVKRVNRLTEDDQLADYPYIENGKKFCIVIQSEENSTPVQDERTAYAVQNSKTQEDSMAISHEFAMKLWNKRIGKSNTRWQDRKGREIRKEAYGDVNSKFGCNIHHKIPISEGGTNAESNLEFVHWYTHDEIHGQV